MRKRILPIWLLSLAFAPLAMQAQQLKSNYIQWWPNNTEKSFPQLVKDWNKNNPRVTGDDNFFISRVKPKKRFRNVNTQVNRELNETNDKRLVAWLPFNIPSVNALPNGVYDSEVFSVWSYVDHWGNWNCPLGRIPAAILDVAHKNGVAVSSVAGIPFRSFAGNVYWEDYLRGFNGLDATQTGEFMHYHGYDGLGYNSEYNDYSIGVTGLLQNLHKGLNQYFKDRNHLFENMWYDGTTDEGTIDFDKGLGQHNSINFGRKGQEAASLFFNYNWSGARGDILTPSVAQAESMGRDPLYLYAGVNMQGGEPRNGVNWTYLKNHRISIGLWGAHSQNMFFEGRGERGSSADAKQRTYMLKTEQWFGGGNRNPVNLPTFRNDLNHSVTNTSHPGMASMMSARSSLSWNLSEEPFITYFNLGNGKFFNWKGKRQHSKEWYNVGVQDYLPTWRWWFSTELLGKTVPATGLDAEFTWDDAYMGGSCLRVYGSVDNEYLQLFKTKYELVAGDVITIRYKLVNGTGKANLILTAEGAETLAINEETHNLIATNQEPDELQWVERTFVVGSGLAGKTLALVGLHFSDVSNMNLYLGEFSIIRGTAETPQSPVITNKTLYSFSNHGMDGKLIWNMPNNKGAGEPCYNTDVKTSVFKLYAEQEGGTPQLMGITTSWAGMLYSIPISSTLQSSNVRLGVQAVSLDYKNESPIVWTEEYITAPTYEYNDNIEISQQVLKAGEAFTIKYSDERHTEGTWVILDPDGNEVLRKENVKSFVVENGLSIEGNYTVKVIGEETVNGVRETTTREFAGFIQITPVRIGAVPKILSLTANEQSENINITSGSTVNLAYTGRSADGTLSRGINMKELGMAFNALDVGIRTANKAMSYSFWVKYNTIAVGDMQFFDIRDQGTEWPYNNWGVVWSTYRPATKDLQFTIRSNARPGAVEHTQYWELDLRTDVWYHFVITFEQMSDGTVREHFYVNGKKAKAKNWTYNNRRGDGLITFGQRATASWSNSHILFGFGRHGCSAWDAVIDDVKFYGKTLTEAEVVTAMKKSDTSDGVTCFWNFENEADENHYITGQGTSPNVKIRRVTKVAGQNEGQGEFFARAAEYEAGCPFVDGRAFSVITTPDWRTRKAVILPTVGGNSQAGTATVSYGTAGDYNVTLTLKNSHGADTRTFSVIKVEGNATGINGAEASEMLTYTVDKDIFVEFAQEGKYTVEVFNLQGAKVASNTAQVVAGAQMNVHVGVAGVYVLKVVKDGKVVRTAKLLCK